MFKSNDYYVPNNVLRHWEDTVVKQDRQRLSPHGAYILEGNTVGYKMKQYSSETENPDSQGGKHPKGRSQGKTLDRVVQADPLKR